MWHATSTQFVVIDEVAQSSSVSDGSAAARRFALRERTAGAHALLDQRVGRLDSMDRYAGYLKGMLRFRAPVEEALSASPAAEWQPRLLAAAIRTDLDDLGLTAPPLPERHDLHLHSTCPSGLLGILYVLEGATLGARLLYRDARALGLSDAYGARHLALQAADTGSWRAFLALLGRSPAFDLEPAAIAALATFALAHDALVAA
jgi:heme oxygenase